jgi:hypothetical protein
MPEVKTQFALRVKLFIKAARQAYAELQALQAA